MLKKLFLITALSAAVAVTGGSVLAQTPEPTPIPTPQENPNNQPNTPTGAPNTGHGGLSK